MTSPYSTPRYPGAPNPTPRTNHKSLRAPIHNPYDKFTQPEFDAWISDITGALKRALGQEDPAPLPNKHVESTTAVEEDTVLEDSFAEVKARRLAKGKERAREEELEEPEARQEERGEEQDAYEDGWGEPYDGEEYSGEEDEESREGSPEVIELLSDDDEREGEANIALEMSEEEDANEEVAEEYDEEAEGSDVGSEDEDSQGESPAPAPSIVAYAHTHEVLEVLGSDDDEDEDEADGDEHGRRMLPARFQRKPDIVADARIESDDGEEYEDELDEEQAEEEEEPFPPRTAHKEPVEIDDPWRGPATYAEDFYSGGDFPTGVAKGGNAHVLPREEDEQNGEGQRTPEATESRVQKEEDDFIPEDPECEELQPTPELPDPWEGPRTYAEDFYAGGDALPLPADGVTPSHLTPRDESPLYIPGITDHVPAHSSTKRDAASEPAEVKQCGDEADNMSLPDTSINDTQASAVASAAAHTTAPSSTARVPSSPPSTTLRAHVDWNWPPAFPGRVATGPGHVESPEHEIFEISDDEDEDEDDEAAPDESAPVPASAVPQQIAQPVEPASATAQAAVEAQEPAVVDSSDLYADFTDLYDMDMGAEMSYNMQPAFEPVSPPGLDFGDLPPTTGTSAPVEDNLDVQALDVDEASQYLADYDSQGRPTSAVPESTHRDAEPPTEAPATDSENKEDATVIVSETRRFSVELEEVTDEEDPAYHPSSKATAAQPRERRHSVGLEEVTDDDAPDYVHSRRAPDQDQPRREPEPELEPEMEVIEVDEEENGAQRSVPPADDIDILSVRDDDLETSHMDYIVEEGMTEDRRTAEPALSSTVDEEIYAPSVRTFSPVAQPSAAHADAPQLEERDNKDSPEFNSVATDATKAEHEDSATRAIPTSLERTLSASNIPPPVSANPNVPDPASIPQSPASLDAQSPDTTSETRDATSLPINASQHPLFRKLASSAHTPSGLFTPITTENSASVTPDREDSEMPSVPGAQAANEEARAPVVDTKPFIIDAIDGPEEVVAPAMGTEAYQKDEAFTMEGPATDMALSADLPHVDTADALDSALNRRVVARDFAAGERKASPGTDADVDVDADGEVDLEYVPSAKDVDGDSSLEVLQTVVEPEEKGSLRPSDEETAENPREADGVTAGASEEPVKAADAAQREEIEAVAEAAEALKDDGAIMTQAEDAVASEGRADRATPAVTAAASDREATPKASTPDEEEATPVREALRSSAPAEEPITGEAAGERRPRKRKRASPPTAVARPLRVTRSRTSGSLRPAPQVPVAKARPAAKTRGGQGKGKQRADAESEEEDNASVAPSHASESTSGGSSTAAQKMLIPDSRGTSRASSVASNAPSTYSGLSLPSPTTDPRRALLSPDPTCRFHTISLPKRTSSGPRIHFAVPGCSLGNAELMKDENIEDEGYVKAGDIPRLIRDVESLNLSPYLFGVLRQLVGVDLIREQEVFYIPRSGDGVVMKSRRKARRAKLRQMESISARTLSNGGASRAMAPPSQASGSTSGDSASVAGRLSQRGSVATTTSLSGSELSDLETDEARPAKRTKDTHEEAKIEPAEQPTADPAYPPEQQPADVVSAAPKPRKLQARRSKRLGTDAAAYKPEEGTTDGEEEQDTKKRRKRGSKGGLKRTRTDANEETAAEGSSAKVKRRRVRASISNDNNATAEGEVANEGGSQQ
ncbi:hypothetical protein BN946_scf184403.g21 [Trametes cinnabarina]|uniref:Uncharacterized protein n=1 Tax=Pycnoporus cinnabarinus TaxID=5643 RepID=A0A060SS91_PYCCI|nr:hypothetical protein BN946_scf184403.g21 [Trametes cinnabarina]